MPYDAMVIGGGYAGMAAALQLVRARRSVLVVDGGQRRNRFASHSHGFLGQDGVDPARIAGDARAQLMAYPTLDWVEDTAAAIEGERDGFTLIAGAGRRFEGRRILLALGVADLLPEVEGLRDRWGQGVFHCPYCHGYELGQGAVGVVATGPLSLHQAELLTEWGAVTFLLNGAFDPEPAIRRNLEAMGVTIEETPIRRIEAAADTRLADGRLLRFAGLFTASRVEPASDIAERSGCLLEETPMGRMIRTNAAKQTTVPGIYAGGDVAGAPHSVSLAVADGAMTGIHLHRSLIWPEAVA